MNHILKMLKVTQWSIYPKLVASFLVVIVPILILGLYINQTSEENVSSEIRGSMASKVHFYLQSFEEEIQRLNLLKTEFINDEDLQRLSVIPEALSSFERQQAIIDMINKLRFFQASSTFIDNIKIYIPRLGRSIIANSFEDSIPEEELQALINAALSGTKFTIWNNQLLLSEVYPTMMVATDPQLFVMELALNNSQVSKSLASITNSAMGGAVFYQTHSRWFISDGKNAEIQSELTDYLFNIPLEENSRQHERVMMNGVRYLVTVEHSEELDLALAVYEPEGLILGPLETYKKWFWLLCVLSVMLILIFAYWNFRQIHAPLQRLVIAFRKVEQGDFNIHIRHWNQDEFNYLYKQFNSMLNQINILISEVYEQKILSQKSELKQLQSQVNPHFLYNSFYMLYRIAEREEMEKVMEYTQYLGDYFRFITRSGSDEVRLEEEVAHALAYIRIQSLRFASRIETMIQELPADYRNIMVPRLILQPILENVYNHGLENKAQQGTMEMSFKQMNDTLTIIIEDNGDDLSDKSLRDLQALLLSGQALETTGMVNVHRRLQLKFGMEYGLSLVRGSSGGLCVLISIPYVEGA